MKTSEIFRSESGRVSVAQVIGLLLLVAIGYGGLKYVPVWMNTAAMKDIARTAAAKMVIEHRESTLREEILSQAKAKGIPLGASEIVIQRHSNPIRYIVTLKWTEQVKHPWGANQVMKRTVTAEVTPGSKLIKNAE